MSTKSPRTVKGQVQANSTERKKITQRTSRSATKSASRGFLQTPGQSPTLNASGQIGKHGQNAVGIPDAWDQETPRTNIEAYLEHADTLPSAHRSSTNSPVTSTPIYKRPQSKQPLSKRKSDVFVRKRMETPATVRNMTPRTNIRNFLDIGTEQTPVERTPEKSHRLSRTSETAVNAKDWGQEVSFSPMNESPESKNRTLPSGSRHTKKPRPFHLSAADMSHSDVKARRINENEQTPDRSRRLSRRSETAANAENWGQEVSFSPMNESPESKNKTLPLDGRRARKRRSFHFSAVDMSSSDIKAKDISGVSGDQGLERDMDEAVAMGGDGDGELQGHKLNVPSNTIGEVDGLHTVSSISFTSGEEVDADDDMLAESTRDVPSKITSDVKKPDDYDENDFVEEDDDRRQLEKSALNDSAPSTISKQSVSKYSVHVQNGQPKEVTPKLNFSTMEGVTKDTVLISDLEEERGTSQGSRDLPVTPKMRMYDVSEDTSSSATESSSRRKSNRRNSSQTSSRLSSQKRFTPIITSTELKRKRMSSGSETGFPHKGNELELSSAKPQQLREQRDSSQTASQSPVMLNRSAGENSKAVYHSNTEKSSVLVHPSQADAPLEELFSDPVTDTVSPTTTTGDLLQGKDKSSKMTTPRRNGSAETMTETSYKQVTGTRNEQVKTLAQDKDANAVRKTGGPPAQRKKSNRIATTLPRRSVKFFSERHTTMKLSKDAIDEIERVSESFWANTFKALEAYALHAGRKTVSNQDVILLMKTQRAFKGTEDLHDLIREYLPMQMRSELIPVAKPKSGASLI